MAGNLYAKGKHARDAGLIEGLPAANLTRQPWRR